MDKILKLELMESIIKRIRFSLAYAVCSKIDAKTKDFQNKDIKYKTNAIFNQYEVQPP